MLKFYFSGAPNPTKVALFLEETGIPYEAIPVDTRKGEQHKPEYLAINPNAKVPAIVDGDVTVFDSNAILLYLGEKTGKFMPPAGDKMRGELVARLSEAIGHASGRNAERRTGEVIGAPWNEIETLLKASHKLISKGPGVVLFCITPIKIMVLLRGRISCDCSGGSVVRIRVKHFAED